MISVLGILLLIALISYSPSDPNFIFPENTVIKNYLGFQGSYISDLFFQSVGIICFLVPITYFFEDFRNFNENRTTQEDSDDLNYSFLSKTFSALSKTQKEKILQILKNSVSFEKTG